MKKLSISVFMTAILAIAGAVGLSNCSKSSEGNGLNNVSLNSIPSASTMLAGTGANGIMKSELEKVASGLNLQSVSGTAPLLKELGSSNADQYFWGGIQAAIVAQNSCTSPTNYKNRYWGQDTATPGPGGRGACMMGQGVGEALSRMMDGASTMCYMKGIGSAANGVTVTPGTASEAFARTSGPKLVKVAVTNMTGGHRQNMDVWFYVYGTNTNSDEYKYDMWMCQNGSVNQKELMSLNLGSGAFSSESWNTEGGGSHGYMKISAALKNENGTIKFDPAADRTAISKFTGSWGTYSGKVLLTTGDIIKAWRYGYNSTWGTNKTYSVSAFSGSGIDTFRFLQGCFKGVSVSANGATTWPWSGITEYRDTKYAAVASSDLSPQCDAFSFTTDDFMSDNSIPSGDFTGLSCTGTPDITITMDFSTTGVQAIQTECEGDRQKLANWQMCDTTDGRTAENLCRQ